jgi:cystathionine beta-synthase
VPLTTPIRELLPLFDAGLVPIVMEGDELFGLVTRIDVVNHLRQRME